MLLPAILLSLAKPLLAYNLPNPFVTSEERPEVAFYSKRLSKYYDLESGSWQDSDVSLRQALTYSQMLSFCRDMYPDREVVSLQQGPPRTLMFCKVRDRTRCSEHDSVTWICLSRSELVTDTQTASPATTASNPRTCGNETSTTTVSYQTCTAIRAVIYSNPCPDDMVFNGMDNVERCNVTGTEGGEIDGLVSADLKCCNKERSSNRDPWGLPDIATLPRNHNNKNPFIPWTEEPQQTNSTVHPDLPREWCGLEQVEAKEKNLTDENLEVMKQIYNANTNSEGQNMNYKSVMAQIKQVKTDLNRKVVLLYKEHFNCLEKTLRDLIMDTEFYLNMDQVTNAKAKKAFLSDVTLHNNTLIEVRRKFEKVCSDHEAGEASDFNRDYRAVVTELQMLRMNIENVNTAVKSWDASNCINCHTTHQPDSNTLPPRPDSTDGDDINNTGYEHHDEPEKKDEKTKLNNQKYLIAIVSTVSVITIIVALIFFIVVVRRTLRKDATGRFTSLPATDELTGDQYVAFLQKNGYANPTCRLPQKYLDDHD